MTVRDVTPRVTALSGHLQIYRDADYHDAYTDGLATGEDIYAAGLEVASGRGLRRFTHLDSQRASNERPAPSCALSADPMNAPAATHGGRYTRPAGATSVHDVQGPSGGHRSAQ